MRPTDGRCRRPPDDAAGVGTLALFFVGSVVLVRGWSARAEVARVDHLAGDVEQEARVHLLEGREAQLVRQIEALEARRDEVVAETAAAGLAKGERTPKRARPKPKLVWVANQD